MERYGFPKAELQMLVDGVEMDFTCVALRNVRRTARVLHARGLGRRTDVRAHLRIQRSRSRCERADDLGLALQLTNILRDVREDAST